jgi:hypothetical protein
MQHPRVGGSFVTILAFLADAFIGAPFSVSEVVKVIGPAAGDTSNDEKHRAEFREILLSVAGVRGSVMARDYRLGSIITPAASLIPSASKEASQTRIQRPAGGKLSMGRAARGSAGKILNSQHPYRNLHSYSLLFSHMLQETWNLHRTSPQMASLPKAARERGAPCLLVLLAAAGPPRTERGRGFLLGAAAA